MRPQYYVIVGGTPKVVKLDDNMSGFNVSIRTDATTVEVTLEDAVGEVGASDNTPGQTWVAAPAAGGNGLIVLKDPVRAVRFSKATNGVATVLQAGLR